MMRKELVVCLLVLVSFCLTASTEAQLFRRWGAPPQQSCPQQQAQQQQLQYQQQQAAARLQQQYKAELHTQPIQQQVLRVQPQTKQEMVLVEVDSRGRVLRQILDSQQLSRMVEAKRAELQLLTAGRQQPQMRTVTVPVAPSQANQISVLPPAAPTVATASVTNPTSAGGSSRSQPVVNGYAVPVIPFGNANAGTQVDIARQAVALPTLAGPSTAGTGSVATLELTQPVVAVPTATTVELTQPIQLSGPTPAATVSLIEPAVESPAGSLLDEGLVADPAVVPAAASEDEPGSISILETGQEVGVSILEAQSEPGNGAALLTGPEGN